MKYQQLENLESGWKWNYLDRKYRAGENITRYLDLSEVELAMNEFKQIKNRAGLIEQWIQTSLNPELENKLKQTIRAKRKRYFDSEQELTRKKSIDLTFEVWEQLSQLSEKNKLTLSEMIATLIANHKTIG